MDWAWRFLADEQGLELSEYAVAAGLIALAIVAAFTNLGSTVSLSVTNLGGKINTKAK